MGETEAAEVVKSGVYRIDLGGGWCYVGSAQDLERRERQHLRHLRRGEHCNIIAQRAYNKYGEFSFTVLGRYPVDEILRREQDLLDEHHSDPKCANILPTAGSPLGMKHTDEARAKMSRAQKGTKRPPRTPEWCAKISAGKKGKEHSPEARANMSAAQKGKKRKPRTPEHRAAISAGSMGKKMPPQTPEHRAKVSAAAMGRKHTVESRAKMSAAATAQWARWRAARVAA